MIVLIIPIAFILANGCWPVAISNFIRETFISDPKEEHTVKLLSKDPRPTYLIVFRILLELVLHRFVRARETALIMDDVRDDKIDLTARYTWVPFIIVCATEFVKRPEMPKSQILKMTGLCLTKMFDGFTSRWRIPFDFKNWSASTIYNAANPPVSFRSFLRAHARGWSCAWGGDRCVSFLWVYASKRRTSPWTCRTLPYRSPLDFLSSSGETRMKRRKRRSVKPYRWVQHRIWSREENHTNQRHE